MPLCLPRALPRRATRYAAVHALLAALAVPLTAAPLVAQGGMLGGLRKRAGEAVERAASNRLNKEIDEAAQKLVDRSFDTMFGAATETADKAGGGASGTSGGKKAPRFALLPDAPTEAAYNFTVALSYEIENMPKGKPSGETALLSIFFDREGKYLATRVAPKDRSRDDAEVTAIFDAGNESMVMLMATAKEKHSIAYGWKEAKQYASSPAAASSGTEAVPTTVMSPDGKPLTFTKLGRRTILGREAEGYKAADENGDMEVWVTRDAGLPSSHAMGPAASMKQIRGMFPSTYPTGLLLEVLTTNRDSGDRGRMTIRSIDTAARIRIDMADYPRLGKDK